MYIRNQKFIGAGNESLFLWGARQTGKSTLLKAMYPDSLYFDLLQTDVFERFHKAPFQLREILQLNQQPGPVIIDEIQKITALFDEVH